MKEEAKGTDDPRGEAVLTRTHKRSDREWLGGPRATSRARRSQEQASDAQVLVCVRPVDPSPSPNSSDRARASGAAATRRGNHTSGTLRRRPSARSTISSSVVTSTRRASGRSSGTEELIPGLQQLLAVVGDQPAPPCQSRGSNAVLNLPARALQPEHRQGPAILHVDVGRLEALDRSVRSRRPDPVPPAYVDVVAPRRSRPIRVEEQLGPVE